MIRKSLCVFLGSSFGNNPIYQEMTIKLGEAIVKNGFNLVYGGSSVGLMGLLADTVLKNGGEVYGVTPEVIKNLEIQHKGLTQLYEVKGMHERKEKMYQLSDAFLAFPGGMGTLDEFCEITTWMQLSYHQKPLAIMNINDFFTPFIAHLKHTVREGFMKEEHFNKIKILSNLEQLLFF